METTLYIQNLKCGGCASTIKEKLNALEGVRNIDVLLEDHAVRFEHPTENEAEQVQQLLGQLGYPTEEMTNSLLAKARSVVSCASGRLKK